MAGIKSLLCTVRFDIAANSHNCRRNKAHRITKGDRRLSVRDGRSFKRYCLECARQILERDAAAIANLQGELEGTGQPASLR